jgi:hypothetical protein
VNGTTGLSVLAANSFQLLMTPMRGRVHRYSKGRVKFKCRAQKATSEYTLQKNLSGFVIILPEIDIGYARAGAIKNARGVETVLGAQMTVSDLITASFREASERYPILHEAWIRISHRVGGLLPNSLLSHSLQRYGELDLALRCMEDELAPQVGKSQVEFRYQILFSEIWVGGIYETLRLLADNSRKLAPDSDEFRTLAHDLRLLRIPLEKHEITSQGQLTVPLQMTTYDQTKVYIYAKDDPQRSHIMPTGISARGSVVWQAIDGKTTAARWIERRSLSDQMIALWGEQGSLKAN